MSATEQHCRPARRSSRRGAPAVSSSAGRCRRSQAEDELLPISLALPIFAADAISSVAYATEAAMVVLVGRVG